MHRVGKLKNIILEAGRSNIKHSKNKQRNEMNYELIYVCKKTHNQMNFDEEIVESIIDLILPVKTWIY